MPRCYSLMACFNLLPFGYFVHDEAIAELNADPGTAYVWSKGAREVERCNQNLYREVNTQFNGTWAV